VGEPVIASLRAELRRTLSTRLWWALGIPVLVLSVLYNLFGALLGAVGDGGRPERSQLASFVPVLSLAVTMALTAVFAAVAGIVGAAGEFRHHTAATTYLLDPHRGRVLLAKMALSGLVGALYAAAAALVGVPAGLVGSTGEVADTLPGAGVLLAVTGIGMVVGALWAAFGAGLGIAIGNQVGALIAVLIYLLFADRVLSLLLSSSDTPAVATLSCYLPGKAADIAVYDVLARGLDMSAPLRRSVVEDIASVSAPPPWWGALLVLAGWTAVVGAIAWLLGQRRDIV
jgi:ABC-2 type transport system permease protein